MALATMLVICQSLHDHSFYCHRNFQLYSFIKMLNFDILLTTEINSRAYCKTSHVGRVVILDKIRKNGHHRSPERGTRLGEALW